MGFYILYLGLLSSSRNLRGEGLGYESHETKQFKPEYKENQMAQLRQQICLYCIQILHLLTLLGRFRVGFGVGQGSASKIGIGKKNATTRWWAKT